MSLRKAIDDKCIDCIYDKYNGGSKLHQIENCLDVDCSIYPYRPLTTGTKQRLREERYASLSAEDKLKQDAKNEAFKARIHNK